MSPELVVVGAGPAGASAALWAKSADLDLIVLEGGREPGGQLHLIHFHPAMLAGIPAGDGPALAAVFARQLAEAAIDVRYDAAAESLEFAGERPAVRTAAGERFEGAALLVATGARRRRLDVPGERELEGHGVSFSARRERERLAGRRVVVAGGGDAAFESALLLAEVGCRVTVAARGVPRARREFRERAAAEPQIEVRQGVRVTAALGGAELRAVRLESARGVEEHEAAGLVIKVGFIPNTEWCRSALALDPEGFVRVDAGLATSRSRVWAAGDVTRPALPSIPVALGQGALAVAAIRALLRGTERSATRRSDAPGSDAGSHWQVRRSLPKPARQGSRDRITRRRRFGSRAMQAAPRAGHPFPGDARARHASGRARDHRVIHGRRLTRNASPALLTAMPDSRRRPVSTSIETSWPCSTTRTSDPLVQSTSSAWASRCRNCGFGRIS